MRFLEYTIYVKFFEDFFEFSDHFTKKKIEEIFQKDFYFFCFVLIKIHPNKQKKISETIFFLNFIL